MEQFFLIDDIPEESKVSLASMHFDGEASAWHQALVQEDEEALILRNWRGYRNRLKERFEEVLDDPIAELKELKETEGIAEYHAKFELIRASYGCRRILAECVFSWVEIGYTDACEDVSSNINAGMLGTGEAL